MSNRSTIHIRFDLGLSGFNTNRQKGGVIFKVQLRANSFPQLSFYMGEGEANNDCIVTPPTDELVQRTHTRNHASVTWCTPLPLPRRGAVNPMDTDTHTHTLEVANHSAPRLTTRREALLGKRLNASLFF